MNGRSILVFLHDIAMGGLAWVGAYWLRFNLDVPADFSAAMVPLLLVVLPVQGVVFFVFGLYRGLWRFASVADLKRILAACAVSGLATPAAMVMTQQIQWVPRSVLLLDPLLLVVLMGGVRFAYRTWKDGHFFLHRSGSGTPVVIIGVGETALRLANELHVSQVWHVVGVVSEKDGQTGSRLGDIPVLGRIEDIGAIAVRAATFHAIIAMPTAHAAARRRVAERLAAAGLSVLTVPALDDLLSGRVGLSSIRKIELEDLLGRERIDLDQVALSQQLRDMIVLITGAGGSIGSELCRQISHYAPRRLVLLDQSELALYQAEQEFSGGSADYLIGDVKEAEFMARVVGNARPEIVFHAAAYKHVPLMETVNAWEAVCNNVLGTIVAARAAAQAGAGEFVLISTDKAVNPTNVMGASKRLAEMACQCLQVLYPGTRFVQVRFGNVLGSSGSVIPKFREQIARGGPVTVTHPDIVRYFMLIPEAAQLVLQAALMGQGGEIFVLDMGEPVKIVDLARDMIRLSGYTEDEIKIEFTGLRPGEKLYEELLADSETTQPTPHPKLRIAKATDIPDAAWLAELEEWLSVPWREEADVKEGLRRWVPEYRPTVH